MYLLAWICTYMSLPVIKCVRAYCHADYQVNNIAIENSKQIHLYNSVSFFHFKRHAKTILRALSMTSHIYNYMHSVFII